MFNNWQKTCCFISRRCNLKCRGCNVINHQTSVEMTTEEWCHAFDIMAGYGVGFIVLFGGEPTLRDDLPEMVEYLNRIGMPHTVITNGVRLLKNEQFYKRLLSSKPFGISASVNHIGSTPVAKFGDQKKSNTGHDLLLKLKKDAPDMDLVANMAVTRENITQLPDMVSYFTKLHIWSILSFFHVCQPQESMYYWYRGPVNNDNRDLVFTSEDVEDIRKVSNWFTDNYDSFLLHNQKSYFTHWSTLGITQDWKCSTFACPAVNPDGGLMACIDRPLNEPFSIFDLPVKEKEICADFKYVISKCPGCFWDHMWETNKYAKENQSELGKNNFAHREDKV